MANDSQTTSNGCNNDPTKTNPTGNDRSITKARDLVVVEENGEWSGTDYRIRSNDTVIVEHWSLIQGSRTGGKLLYNAPAELMAIAQREAADELDEDEQDCGGWLSDHGWLQGAQHKPITLRRGCRVQ